MAHDHDSFGPAYVSPDPEYAFTPEGAGYEHTDANVWMIVKFGLWLLVSAIVIHVGLAVMFALFVEQRNEASVDRYPLAPVTGVRLPPEPRLQRFPANEAYEFRLQEAAALETYGWVDREAGMVRIPIEEAMRRVVEQGLPARDGGEAAAADTLGLMPSDASSGRTMERRRQ